MRFRFCVHDSCSLGAWVEGGHLCQDPQSEMETEFLIVISFKSRISENNLIAHVIEAIFSHFSLNVAISPYYKAITIFLNWAMNRWYPNNHVSISVLHTDNLNGASKILSIGLAHGETKPIPMHGSTGGSVNCIHHVAKYTIIEHQLVCAIFCSWKVILHHLLTRRVNKGEKI